MCLGRILPTGHTSPGGSSAGDTASLRRIRIILCEPCTKAYLFVARDLLVNAYPIVSVAPISRQTCRSDSMMSKSAFSGLLYVSLREAQKGQHLFRSYVYLLIMPIPGTCERTVRSSPLRGLLFYPDRCRTYNMSADRDRHPFRSHEENTRPPINQPSLVLHHFET